MSVLLFLAAAAAVPAPAMAYKCQTIDRDFAPHEFEVVIDSSSQPVFLTALDGNLVSDSTPFISKNPTSRFLQFSMIGVEYRAEVTKVESTDARYLISIKRSMGNFTAKGFVDQVGICAKPVAKQIDAMPLTQKAKNFDVYQFMRYKKGNEIVSFDINLHCKLKDSDNTLQISDFKINFSNERLNSLARSKASIILNDSVWFEHDSTTIAGNFGQYLHGNKKMNDPTGIRTMNAAFAVQFNGQSHFVGFDFEERSGKLFPSVTVAGGKVGGSAIESVAVGFCAPIDVPSGDFVK